jgi:RNA polymerase sigma factor (sigma-70 family)
LDALSLGQPGVAELRNSWESFYARCNPIVRHVVGGRAYQDGDADDCVQAIWLEVVAKLARFDEDPQRGAFLPWLVTLARRKVVQFSRRTNARTETVANLEDLDEPVVSRELDPSIVCQQRQQAALLEELLGELSKQMSPTDYQVLYLRSWQQQTVADVAHRLALSPQQVRYRHCRAKQKLRRLLNGQAFAADPRAWLSDGGLEEAAEMALQRLRGDVRRPCSERSRIAAGPVPHQKLCSAAQRARPAAQVSL